MATSDIINQLDRDMFKNPDISKEELARRLTLLVETLYTIISQAKGDVITNTNITIYTSTVVTSTGATKTVWVFKDSTGKVLEANFVDGLLQP